MKYFILITFSIVYIDDTLIFSKTIEEHWKHLRLFINTVIKNDLILSQRKIKLFEREAQFLGFKIKNHTAKPINRVIQFVDKFPDEIRDEKQLQRFLGCCKLVSSFFKNLATEIDKDFLKKILELILLEHGFSKTSLKKPKEDFKRVPFCLSNLGKNFWKV